MQGIARPLLAWYARHARDLPWRRTRDPYAIWLSEIMLQQTQADRVGRYYRRFLRRFPTVRVLAAAPEEKVLKAWEGLGYYRRARQLRAAARLIVDEHDGHLPDTAPALRRLPGIGRYTAGAIASIAFDRVEPIVEANSRRVIARLAAYTGRLEKASDDEPIWRMAVQLLPKRNVGRFNQALMDLGATICKPVDPGCESCPLRGTCESYRRGVTAEIPRRVRRRAVMRLHERVIVYRRAGSVLVERRGPDEWWSGLWDFPRDLVTDRQGGEAAKLKAEAPTFGPTLGAFTYAVTHHHVRVTVVETTSVPDALPANAGLNNRRGAARGGASDASRRGFVADGSGSGATSRWVRIGDLASLAMTAPGRRVAKMVCSSVKQKFGTGGLRSGSNGGISRKSREKRASCHVRRSRSRMDRSGTGNRSVRRARSPVRSVSTRR